ncbi:tRNA uridine-5-carboxymethylaminomethyl(34) synthesis GTPase MnmE [Rhizobium sp. CSW-27]|uniref:tRNA uridine-5-carboxymethylaminomethyl(34) synthesis GTPase MnmE n=1 Tax=Rhizobium sp. CSW-27 TaxID=2839985 RepID=UPI001C0211C3|nr:tRNA uridine-5-carboxymethylaminomethyl(34) synthesis GTPase MnmE [Rhizobium sp. CSW-27]MBT9372812.1 tRNA uridine-5-carboxymethylaminomethyl(34) synthesis GTPase MnmE [Rhizobium sp. CSW-27]
MAGTDTIFALSSGATPSGVAVIRVSGPLAFEATQRMAALPKGRSMALRSIRRRNGDLIDRGLVLTFPGPHSFTGEDCVEFQLHGGRAVVAAVQDELLALGLRPAEAGEFTQRAFDHGKLDLVEVEGLGDLIAAETEMQRRLAIEQSAGGLSAAYHDWAERLTRCRALIEAELDFADEDDVPGSVSDQVWAQVADIRDEILSQIRATEHAARVRDGFKVVIAGPPNAGKSSFLNAIAARDVAIVTDIAGTTRDVLHVDLDMEGFLVRFYDTAGLRQTEDVIEQEGVRRARRAMAEADLVLLLSEIDSSPEHFADIDESVAFLRIGTKLDLHPNGGSAYDACLSTRTGVGLDEVRRLILHHVRENWSAVTAVGAGRLRHAGHLRRASLFLEEGLSGGHLDLRAESLRLAADEIGRITGRVDVEDLLDVIFSEFCIGK